MVSEPHRKLFSKHFYFIKMTTFVDSSSTNSATSHIYFTIITLNPSTITITVLNISTLVSIKLTDNNYLEWETQIKPFLINQKYW